MDGLADLVLRVGFPVAALAGACAFQDEGALEFSRCCEHMERTASTGNCRLEALLGAERNRVPRPPAEISEGFLVGIGGLLCVRGRRREGKGRHPARTMLFRQALIGPAKLFAWPCRHGQFRG